MMRQVTSLDPQSGLERGERSGLQRAICVAGFFILLAAGAFAMPATTSTLRMTPAAESTAASGSPSAASVEPGKDLILSAWNAYEQGNYKDAVRFYEKLAEEAPDDPRVLYNLGTAYARDGKIGLAIWRYLQAQRLDPRDADIERNLRVLAPQLEGQLAVTPFPPLNWLYQYFTTNEWATMAGAATLLALLFGMLHHWLKRGSALRRLMRQLAWGLAIIAVGVYPFAIIHYYDDTALEHGVVVAEGVVARTGPHENQIETFALPAGTVVRVDEAPVENWVKVGFAGDRVGFIPRSAIRYL